MGFNTDDLHLSSNFQPLAGEANFPPTITREVVGGVHIAPHCITIENGEYVLADWRNGLPRHDQPGTRAVRFPHGLMLYGETFEESTRRLVVAQLGLTVSSSQIVHMYSYVDETPHWHLEPLLLTYVSGEASPPDGVKIVRHPVGPLLPEHGVWRGKPPFEDTFQQFIKDRL